MKIRMIALAGVAALALSTPAMAAEGWYLGLGGGWDGQSSIKATSQVNTNFFGSSKSGGAAIVAGTVGYAWDNGLRLEDEIAWTGHDLTGLTGPLVTAAGSATARGYSSVSTDMANLVYDIPLDENWKLSLGGGVGYGMVRTHLQYAPIGTGPLGDIVNGSRGGLAYQGIAGVA
jgi:hypothetical protein